MVPAEPFGAGTITELARMGDSIGLRILLEQRKAHVHTVAIRGLTPLHIALWGGHLDAVKELLAAGADPLFEDDEATPAILWGLKWLYGCHSTRSMSTI